MMGENEEVIAMLKLLLGRSGTGKTTALLRAIAESGGVRPQLLIVPEQHSHDTERRLCMQGGNQVSLYAEVLSFTRLANRVFSAAGGLAAPTLDAGGRLLLMDLAVKNTAAQLKVYQRPSRKPSFLSGLLATVDELKSCCVSSEQLWAAGEECGGQEGGKLQDISLIYGAYQALTAQKGADPRDKLTRLAAALQKSRWADGRQIYIDGFTDFTPQEQQVIRVLLKQADRVTVALTCDHLQEDEDGTGVFSPARRTGARLVRFARDSGAAVEVEVLTGRKESRTPALEKIERDLFDRSAPTWEGAAPGLHLFTAHTPYSEMEWAASEILRLVQEEGFRYRDIAVSCRSLDGRAETLEMVFQRYGIPIFLSRMNDILQKPVLALITSALDAAAGDYQYEDVFRYLKTGLTDLSSEERDLLENYVLKWDIRGNRWVGKKDWTMHPGGYGLPFREEDTALLERLNEIRRRVAAPLEELRQVREHTGIGQAKALYRFMEAIQLPSQLSQRTQALRERGELTLSEEYRQLWEILCLALEQCGLILGDLPMEQDEFAKLFSMVLSQYDVGAIPVSLDRVSAAEMPRLAHKHCKVLFLLGADDTSLPQSAPSPGLLNDGDRSLLSSYGLELAPTLTDKLYRENTIVYETCALPSDQLFVSWSESGPDGEERRPSFLVRRLHALFPTQPQVREGDLDGSFRLAAPRPALELSGWNPAAAAALRAIPEYASLVDRMEQAAQTERGRLTRLAVENLYGKRVPLSASRMDQYKSCHFAYFMRYGLRASPRKPAGFHAPEYGTFLHYVLEKTLQAEGWRGENGEIDRPGLKALTRKAVDQYVQEELGGLEKETPRFQYLFRRLIQSVDLVVENVAEELSCSDFQPVAFELGFGGRGDLPPVEITQNGVTVSLSGFVDRVDGWVENGKLYLRVVDYKTGRKSFDLTDVWNGLGLQMLLYLFALEHNGRARFGGREIVPAGAIYLPARDAIIAGSRSMTEAERQKKLDAELRRDGLVLDDPGVLAAMEHPSAQGNRFLPVKVSPKTGSISGACLVSAARLGRLERHTSRILQEIAAEIAAGNIAADPFWRGPERNACQWCDFTRACHFEEGRGGDRRRYLPTVRGEEFWQAVEREDENPFSRAADPFGKER